MLDAGDYLKSLSAQYDRLESGQLDVDTFRAQINDKREQVKQLEHTILAHFWPEPSQMDELTSLAMEVGDYQAELDIYLNNVNSFMHFTDNVLHSLDTRAGKK